MRPDETPTQRDDVGAVYFVDLADGPLEPGELRTAWKFTMRNVPPNPDTPDETPCGWLVDAIGNLRAPTDDERAAHRQAQHILERAEREALRAEVNLRRALDDE